MRNRASATVTDCSQMRSEMARVALRRMVSLVAAKQTDRAERPLAVHKEAYINEARFAAEQTRLFLGQPIIAGLSGDIPDSGDVLVFDAAGPSPPMPTQGMIFTAIT